jgi:tetratricopeptide (TPR) repeat protein
MRIERSDSSAPSVARTTLAAFAALLLALFACKSKSEPTAPSATSAAPVASGPCPSGQSEDPGPGEFRPAITAAEQKDYATSKRLFENLVKQYPNSATTRVWRGYVALFEADNKDKAAYKQSAQQALVFYKEAEELHDRGCKLPEREHYYLRMDSAYAHLRLRKPDEAIRHLEIAKANWSNSAEVFYHRARAFCLKGDVDTCAPSFEECLRLAKALQRPKFLRVHNSLDDWVRRSRTQSEFPILRKDKRYAQIIKKYTAEE